MKTKTVYKKSMFPADIDTVFDLLTDLKTLQYVASPYASFIPTGENTNIIWKEGRTYLFKFKMFCILPFGTHTIHVIDFKKDGIYTNESNTFVPVWNHRIELKDNGNGTIEYSDEVEICAGWKTIFVWMWAKSFYSHRQKKWIRLLKKQNSV